MKYSGMVRKIDELGRIVIPKEIRKNINIHDGEELEIIIENNNIVLKKKDTLFSNMSLLRKICYFFKEYNAVDLVITNHERMIISSDVSFENIPLSLEYHELIANRESLDKIIDGKHYLIRPIIIDGSVLGLLMLISNQELDKSLINNFNFILNIIIALYDINAV